MKQKQSACKQFYNWTDKYSIKFKWLIKKSIANVYCEACVQFGTLHKPRSWSFLGADLKDEDFKEEHDKKHKN